MAPEKTPDGRYIIVNGRKWRASDPAIPPSLEKQLVAELMAARRAVRAEGDSARHRVHDAKVALGERGEEWWEEPTPAGLRERLAAAMRTLLRHRDADKTICPSEAARVVGGDTWRDCMDAAREVAAELERTGEVVVLQRGEPVDVAEARGPIRLGRGKRLMGASES